MNELPWIAEGRKYIGQMEIKGPRHNPLILQFWKDIRRGGIKDDETPWCAAYAGAMLERVGIQSSRFESARSYLNWGVAIKEPAYGCIVVFSRDGGGHVGFVVGQQKNGDLMVLGGNQSDAINIRAFSRSRVTGYRWPVNVPKDTRTLPLMNGAKSVDES
ncbi:TIGR02594 family protein [Cedecea davisae]|uniref:TIGR02594 family protein n=1 Tax=Cedecea davisae TaxID=158484 RepID=A0ABS6DDQ6_9ENTR|nr:TIGR02594 family protein [Cedecea davisae]MBU4681192.1 TIGR02594 family protein [Cedecea davisae]MBU4685075.1 TIGR02594 family protein [Cedecea davisae]